jgi:tRNA dimethylallyltransferase
LEPKAKNLVIILGPTAVGKSEMAIRLAKRFGGEIINCDSMQVYQGFDIGTDKVPLEKRENIPHHLIGIIDPAAQFTAADFIQFALRAVEDIQKRKKLPIITGGTGLYLKAFLNGLFPGGQKVPSIRERLERQTLQNGLEHMWNKLEEIDPSYAQKIGKKDKIRIIRALEVFYATKKPITEHFARTHSFVEDFHILKIGLKLERTMIYKKIEERVNRMFQRGLVEEVRHLQEEGVRQDSPPFRALGYAQVLKYLSGEIPLEQAIELTKKETRHYAKRQMTWFRKMKGIHWFSAEDFGSIMKCVQDHIA